MAEDEFSILRDALNILIEKYMILVIIASVFLHFLMDLIDPEKIEDRRLLWALFISKICLLFVAVLCSLLFFADEHGDWSIFIELIQKFIMWIFNSK